MEKIKKFEKSRTPSVRSQRNDYIYGWFKPAIEPFR
mgnify:FL=1